MHQMRGASWRILAITLFVSVSSGLLCFRLYSSENLKRTKRLSFDLFLSLRSFLSSCRSTQVLVLTPFRIDPFFFSHPNRQISSILGSFRRISSIPGQIKGFVDL